MLSETTISAGYWFYNGDSIMDLRKRIIPVSTKYSATRNARSVRVVPRSPIPAPRLTPEPTSTSVVQVLPELTPELVRKIVGNDSSVILEIGANDGTDTFEFARVFPTGQVYGFECDARAAAKWKRKMNGIRQAMLAEVALSDVVGTAEFHPSGGITPNPEKHGYDDWDKSGSLLPNDQHIKYSPWLKFLPPVSVSTTTLDAWASAHCPYTIDFAWVDVQGAEAKVLRGAQQTIQHIRWWYCECHSLPYYQGQATLDEVKSLLPGFVLHSKHEADNYLFRNTAMV